MALPSAKRTRIPLHTRHGRVQRDVRIDNVRGILIILVVLGHFLLPLAWADTRLIDGLLYVIYAFHMPCFVIVSGFYAKSIYKGGRFRWGKAVQMFWLYIVYECVVYFTEGLTYGFGNPLVHFFYESGAPWYLMSLTLWYLSVPLFHPLRGRRTAAPAVIVMFVAVAFLKYVIQVGSLFSLDRTIAFLPFFYLGYFSGRPALDDYLTGPFKRPVDFLACIFALVIFLCMKTHLMKYNLVVYGADYKRCLPSLYNRLWAIHLIWCAVAVTMSLGLIGITLNRRMTIITELGKNTLQIYFLHRPIRDILEYLGLFGRLDPFNRTHVFLLAAFSVVLTIALGSRLFFVWFYRLRTVFDPLLEKYGGL